MTPPVLQFDRFELDLLRYELRRSGRRIKLQRVPMEILILMVERRGALVVREDIVARIWSADAMLDTERSINTAVRQVRQALGDEVGRARFVETVVGKGYRFVAPVTIVAPGDRDPAEATQLAPPAKASPPGLPPNATTTWSRALAAQVLVGVLALGSLALVLGPAWKANPPMIGTPFTALPGSETSPAFSPDGKQVAFAWSTEDGAGQHLYTQPVGGGPPGRLTAAAGKDSNPSWSPDGRFIAFLRQDAQTTAVWVMAAAGGAERRIRGIARPIHFQPAWSADGKAVAILDSEPKEAPPAFSCFRWSRARCAG